MTGRTPLMALIVGLILGGAKRECGQHRPAIPPPVCTMQPTLTPAQASRAWPF